MQGLVKLIMNSLYVENMRRDINEEDKCNSEFWMQTENDENVLDYGRYPNGEYFAKLKQDDGLESHTDLKKTMPAHFGRFILSNSKRIMINFKRENIGFESNNVYCSDTESLYVEKNH